MDKKQNGLLIVLVVALVASAFYIGQLSIKLQKAENGAVKATGANVPTATAESPISVKNLKAMAKKLGLNTGEFDKCLDDGTKAQAVKDDLAYGTSLDVSGTPSFFINGLMVVGALPQTSFESVIDAELKNGGGAKAAAAITGETTVVRKQVKSGVGYIRGGESAKVKIVEFTDFECPFCVRTVSVLNGLMEKYGDKISIEMRNFPLSFHQYAQKSGEAAQCAGQQGKFWEMYDAIFAASAGEAN